MPYRSQVYSLCRATGLFYKGSKNNDICNNRIVRVIQKLLLNTEMT